MEKHIGHLHQTYFLLHNALLHIWHWLKEKTLWLITSISGDTYQGGKYPYTYSHDTPLENASPNVLFENRMLSDLHISPAPMTHFNNSLAPLQLRKEELEDPKAPVPSSSPQRHTESPWKEAEALAGIACWEFNLESRNLAYSSFAHQLLGAPREDQLLHIYSFLPYFDQQDVEALKEGWKELLKQGKEMDHQGKLARKDQDRWVRLKAKAIYEEGNGEEERKIVKIIGTLQDITDTKEKEIQLSKEKTIAQDKARTKSEFVSLMSHEIRTPLNAILGLSYLLLQREDHSDIPAELRENLQSIEFSSRLMMTLINNTLDYSRMEAGKIELEKVNFPLRSLLKGIQRSLHLRASEKRLKLELSIDPDVPAEVAGDPARLTQIINNLCSNAIKFTDKGYVKVAVDVLYESDRDWVLEFSVSDSGMGIPEDRQQAVFEHFVQASASTHRQYGGTGLGLAITKKIVELHHGSIHLLSSPGKGSNFTVRLRYAKAEPALQSPVESQLEAFSELSPSNLADARVLVVDDNPFNRMVACKLLVSWQASVETAENGLEALRKIDTQHFDLVLMDLNMPEMNGFDTIKEIRNKGLQLPIIALTASASEKEKERILALGGNDYLSKPFIPEELLSRLLQHLHPVL